MCHVPKVGYHEGGLCVMSPKWAIMRVDCVSCPDTLPRPFGLNIRFHQQALLHYSWPWCALLVQDLSLRGHMCSTVSSDRPGKQLLGLSKHLIQHILALLQLEICGSLSETSAPCGFSSCPSHPPCPSCPRDPTFVSGTTSRA